MKINRLHGKALTISNTFSAFRPTHNQSGLHEAQAVARQSSRRPQHIQLVPSAA